MGDRTGRILFESFAYDLNRWRTAEQHIVARIRGTVQVGDGPVEPFGLEACPQQDKDWSEALVVLRTPRAMPPAWDERAFLDAARHYFHELMFNHVFGGASLAAQYLPREQQFDVRREFVFAIEAEGWVLLSKS